MVETKMFRCLITSALVTLVGCHSESPDSPRLSSDTAVSDEGASAPSVTFHRDVAPLIFAHCSSCHRSGEGAPFPLLTYDDVVAHASQIVDVTSRRYMPPWLPEANEFGFEGERRLTESQIQTIARWVESGKPEGELSDGPPTPQYPSEWQLGEPDLIVEMDRAYALPAEGPDIYRNFVIPIPIDRPQWVRAMELRPDNRRVVHHAFLLSSHDGECRRLDEADPEPGYGGMEAEGAESPDGHFVSWQPGKIASSAPPGMAWMLTPGTDLVLQMHLQPTGKSERVHASVGFYFTPHAPTRFPTKLVLRSTDIDIPAGDAEYVVESRYTLPTDVRVLGLIPHAHYLGKRLEALAVESDGKTRTLMRIPEWDFNWQGDYRFANPPLLKAGTVLVQRFSYDNSAKNIRNPHSPPQRVQYGLQTTDEMGELWFQVEPLTPQGREQLLADYGRRALEDIARRCRRRLQSEPRDGKSLIDLGKSTLALESPNAAIPLLRQAVAVDDRSATAHYYLGHALLRSGKLAEAEAELKRAKALEPEYQMSWHDLGMLYMQANRLATAETCFRQSLKLAPYHATSLMNLGLVLLKQNQIDAGIEVLEQAEQIRPTDMRLKDLLKQAKSVQSERRSP